MRHHWGVVLISSCLIGPAAAGPTPAVQCPGTNTIEMRYSASISLEQSQRALTSKVPAAAMKQWTDATRALCAEAYRPVLQGTIYPQMVVGCDDRLNRALLKEFRGVDEPR